MALSVLTSVPLTRMFSNLSISPSHNSSKRCVGVWQNDRVEIIANDRQSLTLLFLQQGRDLAFL